MHQVYSINQAPMDMKQLILQFPKQLQDAVKIAQQAALHEHDQDIHHVVIAGLGGSGIGGTIIQDYAKTRSTLPITVTKDYDLPLFVNEHTLIIACSYSGTTEETLVVTKQAAQKGAKIVCISSGGTLGERATQHARDWIQIPGSMPPRACIGYSLVQQIAICNFFGVFHNDRVNEIQEAIQLLWQTSQDCQTQTTELADKIFDKHIIIYATSDKEWLITRIRQQCNENSKALCHHHVVPEMNHNELVGRWGGSDKYAVLRIHTKSDHERSSYRIQLNQEVIKKYTPYQYDIIAQGTNYRSELFYVIHLTDLLSIAIAEKKWVDPIDIKVINQLKSALAQKQ